MVKQDWEDVADLFEQCATMANMSKDTHTREACRFVHSVNTRLSLQAQQKANDL